MLTRRSLLGEVIALGVAPAIMRVAPPIEISSGLTVTIRRDLGSDDELKPGIFISGLVVGIADDYGCPFLIRNSNPVPSRFFFGQVLAAGEERVISKCLKPYPASRRDRT